MIRTPLFAEPCGRGWYIADAEMRDMRGVVYISKRAAVASIRAMPSEAAAGHPLFYTVKEFRSCSRKPAATGPNTDHSRSRWRGPSGERRPNRGTDLGNSFTV
jgi:hypothetical protein